MPPEAVVGWEVVISYREAAPAGHPPGGHFVGKTEVFPTRDEAERRISYLNRSGVPEPTATDVRIDGPWPRHTRPVGS